MSWDRDLLFVYGTLLSGDTGPTGRSQRARLAREAGLLGHGTIEGTLCNLGRYPGLVLPGAPGDLVHGEVLTLSSPEPTLRWLDVYEGIVPGRHSYNEYERARLAVRLDDGRTEEAWVYIYRGTVAAAAAIPDGRWLKN